MSFQVALTRAIPRDMIGLVGEAAIAFGQLEIALKRERGMRKN
jgi:hypothetical protein